MAVKDKKARFNPFVLPSDFFKSDGDPVYTEYHLCTTTVVRSFLLLAYFVRGLDLFSW